MILTRPELPDFDNPPVIEVAMGVQFETIPSLRTAQLGMLWTEFRDEFPKCEEHPPRKPSFEHFGVREPTKIEVHVERGIPVPKLWFINEAGTRLIQVQQDRFVHNWRKMDEKDEYPRYENVREKFMETLDIFRRFIDREGLGELVPNQCELTYVNHIFQYQGWDRYGQIDKLFTVWESKYSDLFLSEPEEAGFFARYIIKSDKEEQLGRLYINVNPSVRSEDRTQIVLMNLTARGKPLGDGIEGVSTFLDIGRSWIVRGFASITSKEMHQHWRRTDEP